MLNRYKKIAAIVTLFSLAAVGLWAQAPAKNWKDRAEYDLYDQITKSTDMTKKLGLLDQWKQKYPESEFKVDRALLYLDTYEKLKQGDKMWDAAKDVLTLDPNNTNGLIYITALVPSLKTTAPDRLDYGEKVAKQLIGQLPDIFSDANRQARKVDETAWNNAKTQQEVTARKTLTYIYQTRKNTQAAEQEIRTILKLDPNSGVLPYQLAQMAIAEQKTKPERGIEALYYFARAAYYTGPDELPPATRTQVQGFLERAYTSFHGSKDGLQQVIDEAKNSPFPPAGFAIKSSAQIQVENENRIKEENPMLAQWLFGIKRPLEAPDGMAYFQQMKGAAIGPLKGKVVSVSPATKPKEILIAMTDSGQPDIKLVMDQPLANPAPEGTEVEFAGVASDFTSSPFLLTLSIDLDLENNKLDGWPAPEVPASKTKGGAAAKGKKGGE